MKVNNVLRHLKFQLVLIHGNNLGLNGIFDMVESFIKTYFCRIFKASFTYCTGMTVEDKSLLTTRENYDSDVKQKNLLATDI